MFSYWGEREKKKGGIFMMCSVRREVPKMSIMRGSSAADRLYLEKLNQGIAQVEQREKEKEEQGESERIKQLMAKAAEDKKVIERLSQTIEEQNAQIDKVFEHMEKQTAIINAMYHTAAPASDSVEPSDGADAGADGAAASEVQAC